ncbi:tripartite tricarboxylate transporter substrate binding protein [Pusillimonas sp. SM2304]|uniref:Bug family tripartite tricarboxylate transporter substrate binding protein n=1 Tax=Pusillimonas sp. SM2304 TaxID=3073241 RepID=UPI002876A0F2|nr:tripartite tricarboxylate transporter substrate binding protein [Pusillimonas sp. SM2304]MDS1139433.1 tripartite tricarboxylate transporter substrate binding protein [Pusillimonas sp. SM2304]
MISFRTLFACGLMTALMGLPGLANAADNYPQRVIKLIVPFPPGGGTDMFGRVVAEKLTNEFGWNIVVENRPGAGGNIGVDAAVKSAPNGYTIVLGQTSNLAINPTLYPNLPYDPLKDLTPIVLVAASPIVLAVGADSQYKSLADVVAASREKPESVSLGFSGNGTVSHLAGAFMQSTGDIKFMMVPYKGASFAITDLMGNRIDMYMSSVPTLLGSIQDKKLRALGVTSSKRVGVLPDVPTLGETKDFQGYEAITWFGLLAPSGTPQPIIAKINDAVNKVLDDESVVKKLEAEGSIVLGGTSEQFKQRLASDTELWAKIIRDAGVKLN